MNATGGRPRPGNGALNTAPQKDEQPRLLRPLEAFTLLSVGRSKGYELLARGEIPGIVRFGPRCTRIRAAELRRWLEGREETTP